MRTHSLLHYAYATVTSIALLGLGSVAYAQNLPSYMEPITGRTASSPADTATKNVLALNTGMFELYGDAGQIFQRNLLSKHPVILALFSGAGGRFILYRPGMVPLDAPPVPAVYPLLKSVAHSTMALAVVVEPYLNSPNDQSWRGGMAAYRSRIQTALDSLDATDMQDDWRASKTLTLNLGFRLESSGGVSEGNDLLSNIDPNNKTPIGVRGTGVLGGVDLGGTAFHRNWNPAPRLGDSPTRARYSTTQDARR